MMPEHAGPHNRLLWGTVGTNAVRRGGDMGEVAVEQAAAPLVLALDVGTSAVRAQVYDAQGRLVAGAEARAAVSARLTADGAAAVDADALVDTVAATLDALAARAPAACGAVAGVGLATFWHTLVGVDPDGHARTPLLLWADRRAAPAAAELRERLDERAVHARTGCRLHATYWPARLRWWATTRPAVWRQVARWLSFGDYLYARLFGEVRTSLSLASATGLLDQHTRAWDPALLAVLGLDPVRLPAIDDTPYRGLRAPYATRWPGLARVPWWPAWGDGACSNVGCGALGPARRALMVGSSAALRVVWPAAEVAIPWAAWGYRLDARRVVLGGAFNDGGNLLAWWRATLGLADGAEWLPAALAAAVAAREPDSHGLTVLPLWGGERSPGWATAARGAIVGLTFATGPADLWRATLEAIALRFAWLDDDLGPALAAATGHDPGAVEIVATGGALVRAPVWLQIVADALGRPVVASAEGEASCRGAALLALEALGAIAAVEQVPAARGPTYQPDAARHARYRVAMARQQALYRLLVANGR